MLTIDSQTDIKDFYRQVNRDYPMTNMPQCFSYLDQEWTNFCYAHGLEIISLDHYFTYGCYNTKLTGQYKDQYIKCRFNYDIARVEYQQTLAQNMVPLKLYFPLTFQGILYVPTW